METKIAYKVVTVEDGKYVSAITQMSAVEYKVGKWTLPPEQRSDKWMTYPFLFVFKTLRDAEEFSNACNGVMQETRVFKCEIEPFEAPHRDNILWPVGTLFAKRVKLLEEVRLDTDPKGR